MPPPKTVPASAAKHSGVPSTSRRRASSSPTRGTSQKGGSSKSATRAKTGASSTSKKRSPSPGPSHGQKAASPTKDRKRPGSSAPTTFKRAKRSGAKAAGGDDEKTDAATTRWIEDPKEREARRKEDLAALKYYPDLHYPGKQYRMDVKDDHSGVKDYVKMLKKGDHETPDDWERQRRNKGKKYVEEYIVGTAAYNGVWDESKRDIECWILIVHQGMSCGEWMLYSTKQGKEGIEPIQWFRYREYCMSKARQQIMKTFPSKKAFDTAYPHVFLPLGEDDEWWGDNDICRKQTYLMGREKEFNAHNLRDNLAPVAIADWTGKPLDEKNFMIFLWKNRQILSPRVARALKEKLGDEIHIQCGKNCRCSGGTNACPCSQSKDYVECCPSCKCDAEKCSNRTVQHGRQHFILLLNTHDKGWTVVTLEEIQKGALVGIFSGEVMTAEASAAHPQTYVLPQPKRPVETDGTTHEPFCVNALNVSNEGRFIAHSCSGNVETRDVFIDRSSWSICTIAFFAKKTIGVGMEPSFPYHYEALKEAIRTGTKFYSNLIFKCTCNSNPCWLLEWNKTDIKNELKRVARVLARPAKRDTFIFPEEEEEMDKKKKKKK